MSAVQSDPAPRRRPLRVLSVVLLGCESLALVALAVYTYTVLPADQPQLQGLATGLALFFLVFAVLVALAARSLWNFGRFGVSFGVTWQLFQALVSASALENGLLVAGASGLLSAIAMFVLLLRPENRPTRELLVADDTQGR